jgi:RNA 2',3'-cyclic 3'-phosphodiesterase
LIGGSLKKRLFIALGASDIYKEALPYIKKLKTNFGQKEISVQWVPEDNWHITLVFLGETSVELIPKIKERLLSVCHKSQTFKLHISDFGGFPDTQGARVVWLGVQRSQALLNLQTEIETELSKFGLMPEAREYWPHLTVGRLRNKKSIVDAISPVVRKKVGDLYVDEVRLYESTLAQPYPKYEILEKFSLFSGDSTMEKKQS